MSKKRLTGLYNSTSLGSKIFGRLDTPLAAQPGKSFPQKKIIAQTETVPGSVAIIFNKEVHVPHLSEDDIIELNQNAPQFVTRLIDAEFLDDWSAGFFRFGTIKRYRATEADVLGRLGDTTEGEKREFYKSQEGIYENVSVAGVSFFNSSFEGFENDIVVRYIVNDFCSCTSIGKFDEKGALEFRENGNDKLGAYITYDLQKLTAAIRKVLTEDPETSHLTTVGQSITYDHKDRRFLIGQKFDEEPDALRLWLGTAFFKPPAFKHEYEFRMLIIDPKAAGRLHENANAKDFNDPQIARAIVATGMF